MAFWTLNQASESTAVIDAATGKPWTYTELRRDVARFQSALPRMGRKSLGLLISQNCYECLVAYLAALNAGCALMLVDATLNAELLRQFVETYCPDWIFAREATLVPSGYRGHTGAEPGVLEREEMSDLQLHPDLGLLLSTSGSTGSPKLVRLSSKNVAANARSIAQYLCLTPHECPITSLPMSYSYGLSVINSHLHVGAAIVFTNDGVLRREFSDAIDRYGCTSFAGVPYTYQMLLQTGLLKTKGASLTMLTQAGGRLEERYIQQMYELALSKHWKFYVMYGQTEATARISYVPFERLAEKIGSVGIAIPDGALSLDEEAGELLYSGPNVMMGYAESREDLAKGDELGGVLRTGDLARQDADGFFYITGRLKRFLKLFGKRFNLDEVEKILSRQMSAPVACYGRDDLLMIAVEGYEDCASLSEIVCETFGLPRMAVKVVVMTKLPRTLNGKLDYQRLADTESDRIAAATG
jgi:long-chain acyl-CoA synthetase